MNLGGILTVHWLLIAISVTLADSESKPPVRARRPLRSTLDGKWLLTKYKIRGHNRDSVIDVKTRKLVMTVKGKRVFAELRFTGDKEAKPFQYTIKLRYKIDPHQIDILLPKTPVIRGLFKIKKNVLIRLTGQPGKPRPESMKGVVPTGATYLYTEWRRIPGK